MLFCTSCRKLFVGISFMFGQKVESLRYRSKKHLTVRKKKDFSPEVSLYQNAVVLFSDNIISLPYSHPVPNVLTGHQWLQVVSSHVVRRSFVDLLRHPLQEPNWNISVAQEKPFMCQMPTIWKSINGNAAADLHMKESHSSMKWRVFSTPRVSEPQCSKPKLVKSFRMSRRSLDEMSQCLLSLISVKIQGLIRAPLRKRQHQRCQINLICTNVANQTLFYFTVLRPHPPRNHDPRNSRLFCPHGIFIRKNVSIAWVTNTNNELIS